jgi:hypothetical protein
MLEEYDFRDGVRGKYANCLARDIVLVVLDSDVAELFPDSATVNEALRLQGKLARTQRHAQVPEFER